MENLSCFITLIVLFIIITFTLYWYSTIPKNLPPGPRGLPIVGSFSFVNRKLYLTFSRLGKLYGNVFHIYLGSALIVVLNDFDAIKEAFIKQGETFSGRIEEVNRKILKEGYLGLVQNDGKYWRQHRRFLASNLRNNGVGKHVMEPRIMNEIHAFINEIRKTCGKPIHIKNLLNYSLLNNVLLLVNNTRCDYDDTNLIHFVDSFNRYLSLARSVALRTFFPWIKNVPGFEYVIKVQERAKQYGVVIKAVEKLISTKNVEEDGENTYIKAFIAERNKRLQESEHETIFTEDGLIQITRDLLGAGGETSSTLLCWIMLYLTKFPRVQMKVQEEIDKTIGREREAAYDDRLLTPYAEAVVMETQRIVTLTPLAAPHRSIRETTLFGYTIPKSTIIFPNIYAVHHDPKLWGDSETFRPERFIGENGQLIKPEYLIPFSMGKRACVGEPLAKMEIYLYFVSLLQNFQLVPTETYQNLEAKDTSVRLPVCDLVCFKPR